MMPRPSLLGLVAFDAVARHRSFSKAGRELHISQGAVSHRIRSLEEELEVVLLTRSSRRVALTEPGRVLFRASREAFERLWSGVEEMRASINPSRITVSCSPSLAIRWLVPHLGQLRERLPEVDIHIAASDELVEPGVGFIDVCIRFGAGGYEGVEAKQLTRERVTAVCSPLYQERMGLYELSDLRRCILLHDDVLVDHVDHLGWREWLDQAQLWDVSTEHGVHFSHSHLALDAAAAGQGVALARCSLIRQDLAYHRLISPFELDVESKLTYWLITPRGGPQNGSVDAFGEWLGREIGSEFRLGDSSDHD